MFNLFNRKKKTRPIAEWEMFLLYHTLEKLPKEFAYLKEQVEQELFVMAGKVNSTSDPDYTGFSYDPAIVNDYDNRREEAYNISNIRVADMDNNQMVYTIHVAFGLICGYSLKGESQSAVDINSVDTSTYVKSFLPNEDFDKLSKILSKEEIACINRSWVYEVELKGTVYYHIRDLEDGDFIGIDMNKTVYSITHDPFEIVPLDKTLQQIWNEDERFN